MLEINNKIHKLCLIDTCVISEILKNKSTLGNRILNKFIDENYIFCYTIQTIGELRRAKDLYDEFFKYLFPMLSFLMKNYNQLIEDEIKAYPNKNIENPFLFFFDPLSKENFNQRIKEHLDNEKSNAFFENEMKESFSTLCDIKDGAKKWRSAFPKSTKKEIEEWVKLSVLYQIKDYEIEFFNDNHTNMNNLEYKKFYSWLMISYVKYYKFYLNPLRNPKLNDLNDVLNTSSLPYMDAIICEKDLAEILKQIQNKHDFVKQLEIMTLNNFK